MQNRNTNLFKKTLVAGAIAMTFAAGPAFSNTDSSALTNAGSFDSSQAKSFNRYIIKFKNNSPFTTQSPNGGMTITNKARSLLRSHGATLKVELGPQRSAAVEMSPSDLKRLVGTGAVEFYEIDPVRWLLAENKRVNNEFVPYGLELTQADQLSDSLVGNRKVCIVDTGYEASHDDLISNGVTGNSTSATGNWWEDGRGHGTHVAGTIAAIGGNQKGVTSINPSGNLGLHIVKVFGDNGEWGYGSDLVNAINQCRSAGANVINMSLGGSFSSTTESNAFTASASAGVLSVAASGNSGVSEFLYPSSYSSVMSVGALDSNKRIADFSTHNSQLEITAPGVAVGSTYNEGRYTYLDGTSMASPHVAGIAALVWSYFPNSCSASDVRTALVATADDLGSNGRDSFYGYGLVQAKDAYDYLAATCGAGNDGGSGDSDDNDGDTGGDDGSEGVSDSVDNLSASSRNWVRYTLNVPAGVTSMSISIEGGRGDADLYVNYGSETSTSNYDCRPYESGNDESCTFDSPTSGTWHIGIRAYRSFSGLTLNYSYE